MASSAAAGVVTRIGFLVGPISHEDGVVRKASTYAPEVWGPAVRMELGHLIDYPSNWAAHWGDRAAIYG